MEKITIRPLKPKDSRAAALLLKKILPELAFYTKKSISDDLSSYTPKYISGYLKNRYTIFAGAWAGKRLVGALFGWGSRGGLGYMDWLVVEPDCRRKRVAEELVRHFEHAARKMGMYKVWWDTGFKNKKMNAFNRKMGYKKVATLRDWDHHNDMHFWAKELA